MGTYFYTFENADIAHSVLFSVKTEFTIVFPTLDLPIQHTICTMFTVFFSTSVQLNKTNDEAQKRAAYLSVQSYDIESSITTDIQKASGGTY